VTNYVIKVIGNR